MIFSLKSSPTVRGLVTLYTSTLLAGMWSMIVPALPVCGNNRSAFPLGTAAQIITAFGASVDLSVLPDERHGPRSPGHALRADSGAGIRLALRGYLAAGMPWFGLILVLVFLIGVAESVWVIAREVAGIDLARPDQRGRVLSGFHGVNYLGFRFGSLAWEACSLKTWASERYSLPTRYARRYAVAHWTFGSKLAILL